MRLNQLIGIVFLPVWIVRSEGECSSRVLLDDGEEAEDFSMCGLYMAESSIPNSGWGMYTGKPRKAGDNIHPLDVSIQFPDYNYQREIQERILGVQVPRWLMHEYYWQADVVYANFEADDVDSILPGFGMLANSHTGLVNLEDMGSRDRAPSARHVPSAGAYSHYHNLTFIAKSDLPAGHELFAPYGDEWFSGRTHIFGELPLSDHFEAADELLGKYENVVSGDLNSEFARDLWDAAMKPLGPLMSPRLRAALPASSDQVADMVYGKGSAYATVPNVVRSTEWLEENGMCLDNILTYRAKEEEKGYGAFASRFLKKGTLVAPAPLIHMHRKHLDVILIDRNDQVLWQGKQLLLNYCYGHPSSSIVLFPYSPGVNLINHGKNPNVAVRWSNRMSKPELLNFTTEQLTDYNAKAGLMMEFYALRDIQPGEEILLDYGDNWQKAWDEHVANWEEPVNARSYVSAWHYDQSEEIYTIDEPQYPPSWVDVRCWFDDTNLSEKDELGWYEWRGVDSDLIGQTHPCRVVSAQKSGGVKESYNIGIQLKGENEIFVKDVPWSAISFVEKPYTGHQFLRESFRHEILLPDEMIPQSWRDLDPVDDGTCGLYTAQSSIPNSGLGMYSARKVDVNKRIFHPEVVVQVEDFELNMKLREWYLNRFDSTNFKWWLLDSYYWNPAVSFGIFEANEVGTIIAGLGMLANSHPGLVNAYLKPPIKVENLHRAKDVGAGASSSYHDVHYVAERAIVPGEELFVRYGDSWFSGREDFGNIPLSKDFFNADEILRRFRGIVNGDNIKEGTVEEIWNLIHFAINEQPRLAAALPAKVEDTARVHEIGSAKNTVPNSIRSLEWLETHGRCLDNIKPGPSTIRQAGMGAFATRQIKKGQVVAPMPLVHIRRRHMEVYESQDMDDMEQPVYRIGTQLLLNYCYGHPNSTLLFFPYSPVTNYMNHNATNYNVKLQWSSLPNHQISWLSRGPDDLERETHSGLIMEVVAVRDIKAGEEILLNYGAEWQHAWENHERQWRPNPNDANYVSAATMNKRVEWLRTEQELAASEENSYKATNVTVHCFVSRDLRSPFKVEEGVSHFQWKQTSATLFDTTDNLYPCDILSRDGDFGEQNAHDRSESIYPPEMTFTARVYRNAPDNNAAEIVHEIPRGAIRFFDMPYTSDLFLRQAFRHEIGIPDDMIPSAWRDI